MEDFEDLIGKDGFVEHAQFGGNRYGTSKMTIEEQTKKGKVVLLDIEMEVRGHMYPLISVSGYVAWIGDEY
jgi:guanylate kinase